MKYAHLWVRSSKPTRLGFSRLFHIKEIELDKCLIFHKINLLKHDQKLLEFAIETTIDELRRMLLLPVTFVEMLCTRETRWTAVLNEACFFLKIFFSDVRISVLKMNNTIGFIELFTIEIQFWMKFMTYSHWSSSPRAGNRLQAMFWTSRKPQIKKL